MEGLDAAKEQALFDRKILQVITQSFIRNLYDELFFILSAFHRLHSFFRLAVAIHSLYPAADYTSHYLEQGYEEIE